jgi:hypothetical protein
MSHRASRAAIVLSACLTALPAAAQNVVRFGPPQALTIGTRAVHPSVVVDQAGETHVVFNRSETVYYTRTVQGAFTAPIALDNGIGASHPVIVRGLAGELHVLYIRESTDKTLYYRRGVLTAGQMVWSARLAIAGNTASKAYPGIPVTDASGTLHVPYIENTCGYYRVFYRARRTDGSWTVAETPLPTCEYQTAPQAVVGSDNHVKIIFTHGADIAFASRESAGWTTLNLSGSPQTNSNVPTLARTFGSYLFAAWDEGVNAHDIQARVSADSGKTWGPIFSISSSPQYATGPTVQWIPGTTRVGLSWIDATGSLDNQPDILDSEVDVVSRAMTTPVRLAQLPGAATLPSLSVLGGASLVWQDKTSGDWQIFVAIDPGAWNAQAKLVCLNGQTPTVTTADYHFFWSMWPPNPLVWQYAPASQLLRMTPTAPTVTNSSFYLGLENNAGTEVLGPVLGAPHPAMVNSTFFNPPTLMLRWALAEVPKGVYGFSFYAPPRTCPGQAPISVLTPNGGEVVPLSGSYSIRWLAGSEVGPVRIEVSTSNGATWQLEHDLVPNNGLYSWWPTVTTTQGRIRISSTANPTIRTVSAAPFTVR